MLERDFQKRVTDMAVRFGWKFWHIPAPMRWSPTNKAWVPARSGAGVADLILTHDDPPRLVFLELKGDGGELSDRQRDFLQAVKTVAGYAAEGGTHAPIGVVAAWPKDEPAIEQMLRTRNVA